MLPQEPPEVPKNFRLVKVTSRSANFSWTPPYDGQSAITAFKIQYKQESRETQKGLARNSQCI